MTISRALTHMRDFPPPLETTSFLFHDWEWGICVHGVFGHVGEEGGQGHGSGRTWFNVYLFDRKPFFSFFFRLVILTRRRACKYSTRWEIEMVQSATVHVSSWILWIFLGKRVHLCIYVEHLFCGARARAQCFPASVPASRGGGEIKRPLWSWSWSWSLNRLGKT